MSEPISPDEDVGPAERLHPLFLLSGLTGSLRRLAGGYALLAYLLVSGKAGAAILGAVALVVVGIAWIILYWRRFEFRVGAHEIRIDSGILSRTHRSIPFDRIQDVDISQGPLQRVLGLARVTFETGAGSSAPKSDEGALEAITLDRAQQIRALIRSRGVREPGPADADRVEEGAPVYAMDFGRLLLAGTLNFSLAIVAGLLGITQTFGNALGFDPLSRAFWSRMLLVSAPIEALVVAHAIVSAIAGVLLLALIGLATGIVRTVLRDFGFRLDRIEVGLRRRRGLFTRTDVTLPVKRAQALLVGTGPLRERFGWSDLKLQSLAREEDGKGDHVLAPLATAAEIDAIVERLGWRRLPETIEWIRVSRAFIWMRAAALSPLFLVVALVAAGLLLTTTFVDRTAQPVVLLELAPALAPLIALLVGVVGLVAIRWLAWFRTGYAVDGDRLLVRTGWWRRRLLVLPKSKIQSVDISESFITRWFGAATLRFGVAGGGLTGHSIPAIPSETARKLRDQLIESVA